MNIYLLTHSREFNRQTNTGKLVNEVLKQHCAIFEWQRKKPNPELLQYIASQSVALLYPHEDSSPLGEQQTKFDAYILIDATWQEAQKMVNHSPYLHDLPKVSLNPSAPSIYSLRRNQKETGLCTAECAIELLKLHQQTKQADMLHENLQRFIQQSLSGIKG